MTDRCENCTKKCQQAEMAHEAALGRMYATNEFLSLLKKVESGVLVEVVRCNDCKCRGDDSKCPMCFEEKIEWDDDGYAETDYIIHDITDDNGFCSRGERRTDNEENGCI